MPTGKQNFSLTPSNLTATNPPQPQTFASTQRKTHGTHERGNDPHQNHEAKGRRDLQQDPTRHHRYRASHPRRKRGRRHGDAGGQDREVIVRHARDPARDIHRCRDRASRDGPRDVGDAATGGGVSGSKPRLPGIEWQGGHAWW